MWRAARLPCPIAKGDGALGRDHVAAGEDARVTGHHRLVRPARRRPPPGTPGSSFEERHVRFLAEHEDERVGLQLLQLPGRLWEPGLVELHALDHELAGVPRADGNSHLNEYALPLRLLDLEVVRGHAVAGAPVDDDRLLRAEALCGAGDVHGRVPAAVDGDAAAEQWPLLALHAAQERDGVEDACGRARRDVRPLADVRADGDEDSRRSRRPAARGDAGDLAVQLERHAEIGDALGSPRRAPGVGGGSAVSRTASSRPPWRRRRARSPRDRGARGGRRPRARTGRRPRRAHACRTARRAGRPSSRARWPRSPRKRSTELMPTASSSCARLQAVCRGGSRPGP